MGLTELFNDWIIERGSAKVQEKHLALFRDQLAMADKRISELESENAVLKSQVSKFKSDSENLRTANNDLAAKIKESENPSHKSASLDEPKVKILTFLAVLSDEIEANYIARECKLSTQATQFHLEELEKKEMLYASLFMGAPPKWGLAQEGRRYLIERNLL